MPRSPEASRFLPLKPKTFHVLLALDEAPQHGYAIRTSVAERTRGAIELEPGGLYRLIARLEADGLIAPSDAPPDPDSDDPRRRYYRLTDLGHDVLAEEACRLTELARTPEVAALAASRRSS